MTKRRVQKTIRLVATGGGTAGHVLPHFAVFQKQEWAQKFEVSPDDIEIFYIGSRSGIERELVAQQKPGWVYVPISTGKLRRYFSWQTFFEPFKIGLGLLQSLFFFLSTKPHVVFSKGGFVAAPVVWAAWICRIPIAIHESDVTPALTTRMTAPFASIVALAFARTQTLMSPQASKKAIVCGLPLRSELFAASEQDARQFFRFSHPHRPVLLAFGGSLGAQILNETLVEALPQLVSEFSVIHITGRGKSTSFVHENYLQYEYLAQEMPLAYRIASVALCRAGASSLFELAALRIPMLVVPLGLNQSRGDQLVNASIFEKQGWARVLKEEDLTPARLRDELVSVFSQRLAFQTALESAPGPEAASKLASILMKLARVGRST